MAETNPFDETEEALKFIDFEQKKKFIMFMTGTDNVDCDPNAITLAEAKAMDERFSGEVDRMLASDDADAEIVSYARDLRDGAREFVRQQEQIARDYEAFVKGEPQSDEAEDEDEEDDNDTL